MSRPLSSLLCCLVFSVACRSEPSPPRPVATTTASPTASTAPSAPTTGATDAEVEAFLNAPTDAAPKFTPPLQEALLAKLGTCTLDAWWPQATCEPFKRWRQATAKAALDDKPRSKEMALKYLASDKPAVQCVAAWILGQPSGPEMTDALIDAAKAQGDPAVTACIVHHGHMMWMTSASPKVVPFLLSMAEHGDERVRLQTVDEILLRPTPFGRPFPNAVQVAGKRLDVDPSPRVKARICRELYTPEDETAIPLMEKAFKSPEAPLEVKKACFDGIASAWATQPRHAKPSRAAYTLTLAILARKPRSTSAELTDGLTVLIGARSEGGGKSEEAWSKEVKPWLDLTRVQAALEDFAGDAAVGEEARYSALDALDKLKAPIATFVRLQARCKQNGDACMGRASGALLDEKVGAKKP